MKEGINKGMNMKWSLHMSSKQQNLTIGPIGLKSDYRVVKLSLTTGLGSYPVNSKSNRTHVEEPSDCKEEQVAGDESGNGDVDEAFEALLQEGRHLRVPRRSDGRVADAPAGKSSFQLRSIIHLSAGSVVHLMTLVVEKYVGQSI